MAYAFSSTRTQYRLGAKTYGHVIVTETGVTGATDEWSVDNMPGIGQLIKVTCVLTAGVGGTATSVDPQVGDEAGLNNIFENTTASASTTQYTAVTAGQFALMARTLYGRSKANGTTAGAGNIVTTYWYCEGGVR